MKFKISFIFSTLLITINNLCAQDPLDTTLYDLSQQIVNSMPAKGGKIAVMDFSWLEGQTTDLGKFLAEELITRLFMTKKFEGVIERQLLEKILEEQKFTLTGIFDPETIKKFGRIYGVDAIVTGSITDLGPRLRINARIISTETGAVCGAAAVYIIKTKKVLVLLGQKIPGRLQIFIFPGTVSIYLDNEPKGISDPNGTVIEAFPGSHTIILKKKGFRDFEKKFYIEEDEERILKVKFANDYLAPFKAGLLSAAIPGFGAAYYASYTKGFSGGVAVLAGLAFYPSALLYLIDKWTKPDNFLSEDMESKYDNVMRTEFNIMKYLYLTNVGFGFISGIDYAINYKVGIEISLDSHHINPQVCLVYRFK